MKNLRSLRKWRSWIFGSVRVSTIVCIDALNINVPWNDGKTSRFWKEYKVFACNKIGWSFFLMIRYDEGAVA